MCRKKKPWTNRERGEKGRGMEGENRESSKKEKRKERERERENRELWNIYRRLETDVKK